MTQQDTSERLVHLVLDSTNQDVAFVFQVGVGVNVCTVSSRSFTLPTQSCEKVDDAEQENAVWVLVLQF